MTGTLRRGVREPLADGAVVLRGFARTLAPQLLDEIGVIIGRAPWRHMITPGGLRMSVAMTNCGQAGVRSQTGQATATTDSDPLSGEPWPVMPAAFPDLATRAAADAGFAEFAPDACLINRYEPGTRLSLHQDRDERDLRAPIVSSVAGLAGGVPVRRAAPR
ncbi:alpha-ketoglutarate-dependent dioxygenase AlkB [Cupriavidus basilensis]